MEAKLADYRKRKEEEKLAEQSLINKLKLVLTNRSEKSQSQDCNAKTNDSSHKNTSRQDLNEQISTFNRKCRQNTDNAEQHEVENVKQPETGDAVDTSEQSSTRTKLALKTLKFLLWLALWGVFIELEFGAVFFTASLLLFMYFNTRTGPQDNKPSAYSVFNKDCERIQGTLTAEQMQRNMFRVPGLPS